MPRRETHGVMSRWVPYSRPGTSKEALALLPATPALMPTTDQLRDFRKAYRRNSPVAAEVLGTLRAFSVNGAEVPLAGMALLVSVIAVVIAVTGASPEPWVPLILAVGGVALVVTVLRFLELAFAAHSRRVISTVWLGAYRDVLER